MPTPNPNAISDRRYAERRFEALEAATGQTAPSFGGALPTPASLLTFVASGAMTTGQQSIPHLLPYTPKIYAIVMTTAGSVFVSQAADATNVYVTPDATARQCTFTLGR